MATTNCPDLSRARSSTDLPSCAATPSQGRTSPLGSSGNHRRGLEAYKGTSHVATTRITVVSPQFRAKPSYTREVGTLSGRAPSRCPGVTADPARVIVSRRRWPQSAGSNAQAKWKLRYQRCDHRASTFGSLGPGQDSQFAWSSGWVRGLKASQREAHVPSPNLHGSPSYHGPRVPIDEMFLRIHL